MDMSDNTAPAEGGKKIIILCEKVSKEDIKVRFFDYNGWEEWADPAGGHRRRHRRRSRSGYRDRRRSDRRPGRGRCCIE